MISEAVQNAGKHSSMRVLDAPRLLGFPVKAYYHTGEIVLATATENLSNMAT